MEQRWPKKRTGEKLLRLLSSIAKSNAFALLLITFAVALATHLATGNFFTSYTIPTFIRQATFVIIIGFAQTLVLLVGGLDLSVASMSGLCGMFFAAMVVRMGLNIPLSFALGVGCGMLLGFINSFFIYRLRLIPFIVTLCTSYLFKGISFVVSGSAITGIPASAKLFANGSLLQFIPYPTVIMAALAVFLTVMLRKTAFGRHIYAVGGNRSAAEIVGINTRRVGTWVYAISGGLSAIAGILAVMRIGSCQLSIGESWLMPSITAAVLGGTSMKGGSGGILGTIVGGLLIGTLTFSISVLGISTNWEDIFTGAVVLSALTIDTLRTMKAQH